MTEQEAQEQAAAQDAEKARAAAVAEQTRREAERKAAAQQQAAARERYAKLNVQLAEEVAAIRHAKAGSETEKQFRENAVSIALQMNPPTGDSRSGASVTQRGRWRDESRNARALADAMARLEEASCMLRAAVLGLLNQGCMTLFNGTHEDLSIESTPSAALATLSDGQTCTTPCTLKVSRGDPYNVKLSKPGCVEQTTLVQSSASGGTVAGAAALSILTLGIGVDGRCL